MHYQRPESSSRGTPAHAEHVVVFLVDAWSVAQRDAEAEAQMQVWGGCRCRRRCLLLHASHMHASLSLYSRG